MKIALRKPMLSMRNFTKTGLVLLATLAAASMTLAQDWGTYQGMNARTGSNGDVAGSGPGIANLRWFYPNAFEGRGTTILRNQTSNLSTKVGPWAGSTPADQASDPFSPQSNSGVVVGVDVPNGETYEYVGTTASEARILGQTYDPRIPAAGVASTFTWVMSTPDTQRNYSLYVWVPQGPTGTTLFPQQYFVYDIQYGNGQHYVDVVNTFQSGWIRLGNGGNATNRTFPYNGTDPITITLYNTVARDVTGQLLDANPANPSQVRPNGVVYADAALAVPDFGTYVASPTVRTNPNIPVASNQTRTVAAFNRAFSGNDDSDQFSQVASGEVSSYAFASGIRQWMFSLANLRTVAVQVDNNAATAAPALAWGTVNAPGGHIGDDYNRIVTQTTSLASAATVTYKPTLVDGSYDVQLYLPGKYNPAGGAGDTNENVGHGTVIQIFEGVVETDVTVNQTQGPGYITIGGRKFVHTSGAPLTVVITNFSTDPTDPLAGRYAYADSVRFSRTVTPAVNSTPIQITAKVRQSPPAIEPDPAERDVVVIAAEDGHLYCVDGKGNGDGTTNLIWVYPTITDAAHPIDPNTDVPNGAPIASKLDGETANVGVTPGTMIAEMPTGFDTSSALVRRNAANEDLLYIGGTNGRVYCIEMAGRGDQDFAAGYAGTTKRRWTFPSDYPSVKKSPLGAFKGSVAFADTTAGATIFAPDSQGRMYALDAEGDATTRTTTTRWTFPALTSPTLGPILTTPLVAFTPQRVFFGTAKLDDTTPGQVWALDAVNPNNAALQWHRDGLILPDTTTRLYDDFLSSPTAGTAAELGGGMPDTVFFANMNSYVTAFSADGAVQWFTNELGNSVHAPLSITTMNVYDNTVTGTTYNQVVVNVPTADNQFTALFAQTALTNTFGGRLAWGYDGEGNNQNSGMSVGRNWMYTGDGAGNFYAFNNDAGASLPGFGTPPGAQVLVPNNPAGKAFRADIKIKLLTERGFRHLTLNPTDLTYNDIDIDPGVDKNTKIRVPLAVEWGERVRLVVYGFPHATNGGTVAPPRVQYVLSTDGKDGRPRVVESKVFAGASPTNSADPSQQNDGYAVIDLAVQGTGVDGLPPGPGRITFNMRVSSLSAGPEQVVAMDPTKNFRDLFIANPLGIGMSLSSNTTDVATGIQANRSMGKSTDPTNVENLVNGSPDVAGKLGTKLGSSPGVLSHGGSGITRIYVWDRSLMTELRGPGRGLDSLRVQSGDLQWQGQQFTVFKPIPVAFTNFEDLPVNFPNTSLDYPNIPRDRMRVTKDPNGIPENPLYGPVTLTPPSIPVDGSGNLLEASRAMFSVPFDYTLDVPKYQPAPVNVTPFTDSSGTNLPSGYSNRIRVFIDSNGNSTYDTSSGSREAMRSFVFTMGVAVDQHLVVTTPTVDLSALANGTAFTTGVPGTATSTFNPRSPFWSGLFAPFSVTNEGNVNLLNPRVAKGTTVNGGGFIPWPIYGTNSDDLAYLNSGLYLFSEIDRNSTSTSGTFKTLNQDPLQKPRVGDRTGSSLSINPVARVNLNLGVTTPTPYLNPALIPVRSPRIGIGLPLGFPSGSFQQVLRVIEDDNDDEALALDSNLDALEAYSDPTLTLKFRSREVRLTTTTTKQPRTSTAPISPADPLLAMTAAIIDDLTPYNAPASNYQWGNAQPAGLRLPDGSLLVAWTSNRPSDNAAQPGTASENDQWRLYVAAMGGVNTAASIGFTPLRDLDSWIPATAAQWFGKSASSTAGYPTVNNATFDVQPGETLLTETVKFGNPAFPIQGMDYSGPLTTTSPYMAFIGTAQKQVATGRTSECRLFLARVSAIGGVASVTVPVSMPYDVASAKSRPFVVQDGNTAVVFYSAATTSGAQMMWTVYNGSTWSTPAPIEVPSGFESANAPSVAVRPYTGAVPPVDSNGNPMNTVLDVTFTGRLRGRSASEVFTLRLASTGKPLPLTSAWEAPIVRDALIADSGTGVYRSLGLGWSPNAAFAPLLNGGGTPVQGVLLQQWVDVNLDNVAVDTEIRNLEVPNTRVIDRATGVISFDCTLGGKVFLDPNLGSVRFTSAAPARNGQLMLSYQPTVLRLSSSTTASYTGSTIMFDSRLVPLSIDGLNVRTGIYGPIYWGRSNNTAAIPRDPIRNDRYVVMYNRGAAGAGQTARPYMKTLRYGIQLGSAIYTRPDGSLLNPPALGGASITVNGLAAGDFFQVDPAKGRVYFDKSAEDKIITITYTGVNSKGQAILNPATNSQFVITAPVALVVERDEAAVPIDQASNESSIAPFLDPYDPAPNALSNRRPGLIWMFWSSTRAGNADIYMQTLAPRFTPVIGGH